MGFRVCFFVLSWDRMVQTAIVLLSSSSLLREGGRKKDSCSFTYIYHGLFGGRVLAIREGLWRSLFYCCIEY